MIPILKKSISLAVVIVFTATNVAYPLPQDATVVEGDATITVDGNTMNIDATDNTIIDFSSFDIAQNESVIVTLPSIDSDILSRVLGTDATTIAGSLSCNGIFILVNTNGIYVADTASIQAAGLVLSTLDINNTDFLDSNYLFKKLSEEQLNMLLLNQGDIQINQGGFAAFIAGAIENQGTIVAPAGTISLASGEAVTLDISGNELISVAIDKEIASTVYDSQGNSILDAITNSGTIEANGGCVILDSESLPGIFERAINLNGTVRANEFLEEDGKIILLCNEDVLLQGLLEADTGHIDIDAGMGKVINTGTIRAKDLTEKGYTFKTTGTVEGETAYYENIDGAAKVSGNYGFDSTSDPGDIVIIGNTTLTSVAGTVLFQADSNDDTLGVFYMMPGTTIYCNGRNLTIISGESSLGNEDPPLVGATPPSLGVIDSANNLILDNSLGSNTTYNLATNVLQANGDIALNVNIDLTQDAVITADNDNDGNGVFEMSPGKIIDGANASDDYSLIVYSSSNDGSGAAAYSNLGDFNNLTTLTLDSSATLPVYYMNDDMYIKSLYINSGTLSQGVDSGIYLLPDGDLIVGQDACWINNGTGDITLGSTVTNDGIIMINGDGGGIHAGDNIVITNSISAVITWSGSGITLITDASVDWQDASGITINAYSCTDAGNNGAGWNFRPAATTQGLLWEGGVSTDWSNSANWSGNAVPSTFDIPVFTQLANVDATLTNADSTVSGVIIAPGYDGTISLRDTDAGDYSFEIDYVSSTPDKPGYFHQDSEYSIFNSGNYSFQTVGISGTGEGGTFTVSDGEFIAPTGAGKHLVVTNDFDLKGGTFTHNNGTVQFICHNTIPFNITADEAVGETTFYNLIFDSGGMGGGGTVDLEDDFTVANDLTADHGGSVADVTIKGSTFAYPEITINGDLILSGAPADGVGMNFGGDGLDPLNNFTVDLKGNFSLNDPDATVFANIKFTGTGAQTIEQVAGDIDLGDAATWTIDKGNSTVTVTPTTPILSIDGGSGLVTIQSGTLDLGASDFMLESGSKLEIESDGIFDVRDNDIDFAGDFENNSGLLRIDGSRSSFGNFVNPSFPAGTVEYYGTGSTNHLTAGGTYYNLKITGAGSTYSFNNGDTITVDNDLTITGAANNPITLKGVGAGDTWTISPNTNGTRSVSYAHVTNSTNDIAPDINALNSEDGGGNNGWTFSGSTGGGDDTVPPEEIPEPIIPEPIVPDPITPDPEPIDPIEPENVINLGGDTGTDFGYEEGGAKYMKVYKKGKYKTVIIVFEGLVVEAPYTEDGPDFENGILLKPGEEKSRIIEI